MKETGVLKNGILIQAQLGEEKKYWETWELTLSLSLLLWPTVGFP